MTGWIIAGIVVAVFCTLVCLACCKVSGACAAEEERYALVSCPRCGVPPHLGYCCGEYFIHGEDPECPYCGTAFSEMRSDPAMEIDAWNKRIKYKFK